MKTTILAIPLVIGTTAVLASSGAAEIENASTQAVICQGDHGAERALAPHEFAWFELGPVYCHAVHDRAEILVRGPSERRR